MTGFQNDLLLQTRELGVPHFDPEVAAGHHHPIACPHHLGQILDRFRTFDLRHQQPMAARIAQELPSFIHVRGIARERHAEIVHLERRGRADILAILVGERAGGQAAALTVDPLVVAEFAADQDSRANARTLDGEDLQADLPIVQQQHVAGENIRRQFLVRDAHARFGARIDGERRVQREFGAVGQLHLAGLEAVDADFRPLQIAEQAHVPARSTSGRAHQLDPARMVGDRAMREIQAHHIHAGAHDLGQHRRIIRGGTQGRDYLGAPKQGIHAARFSRISTAGSFLPSTNSRNAPPPVDM